MRSLQTGRLRIRRFSSSFIRLARLEMFESSAASVL